ncbi:MobA/MobL family protein, partial [Escherichia coli]|uniref:MobA/MobL family protein n=1 Tax=Escherichia coli TaxID=562 RepID=UPI003EDF44AB
GIVIFPELFRSSLRATTFCILLLLPAQFLFTFKQLDSESCKAERRKNSQLAREIELAIPRELPQDAARETVLAFVRENFVSQ